MKNPPMIKALSIRQPWAWLIAMGYKDVENRSWPTHYRGPIFIHAAKTMTQQDITDAIIVADQVGPGWRRVLQNQARAGGLHRGGIIGIAHLTDCVTESTSRWFFGPHGFVLANAQLLQFTPLKGALGLFDVNPAQIPGDLLTKYLATNSCADHERPV